MRNIARSLLNKSLIIVVVLFVTYPFDAANATDYDVPSQALGIALRVFSEQSGAQIIFTSESMTDKRSKSLKGDYSIHDGLNILLDGSGLFHFTDENGVITIQEPEIHGKGSSQEMDITISDRPVQSMRNTKAMVVAASTEKESSHERNTRNREIEEISVTAQKRVQSIQDVSIAVTAFSSNQIEELRIQQPIEIANQVPNFHVKNEVGKATPTLTIRGVGLGAFSHNSVSPVAVYVDEIFLPSTTQLNFSLYDLERVEVLKGPQGDLFGRNTTAGTVSFVSKKPNQEHEARATVSIGNF